MLIFEKAGVFWTKVFFDNLAMFKVSQYCSVYVRTVSVFIISLKFLLSAILVCLQDIKISNLFKLGLHI